MLEIKIVNPIQTAEYSGWLNGFPEATVFHTSAWARVIHSTYGYTPLYLVAGNNNKVRGVLPLMEIHSCLTGKRAVSLPFSDFCDPLYDDGDLMRQVIKHAISIGRERRWKTIQFRGDLSLFGDVASRSSYVVHTLPLKDSVKETLKSFRSSTRRNIKKAERLQVVTRIRDDFKSMLIYYHLHCLTRKKHGLPPPPFSFFKNIYAHMISRGKGFVVTAEHQGRHVAAAVYFKMKDKMIYKYGASDPKTLHLRANNLVMWRAIQRAVESGLREFHFGRTEHGNKGLVQFKDGWGTLKSTINYYKYHCGTEHYLPAKNNKEYAVLNSTMRYMPVFMLRALGGLLYRHIG